MEPRIKQKIQDTGYKICEKINQKINHDSDFPLSYVKPLFLNHHISVSTSIIAQF